MRRREGTFCATLAKLAAMAFAVSLLPRALLAAPIVPAYSSFPTTHTKVYLDFDGDFTDSYSGKTPGVTPAYSIDTDTDNFSASELTNIHQIWQGVAEKYSPFNVNVTTVDPGNENNYETVHVVIGGDGAWWGEKAGGLATLTAYMNPSFRNVAFVFPGQLANGNPKHVAEAAAHEAAHTFGLRHQSLYDTSQTKIAEYNPGDALRAPIMGVSYASQRGLWWRGSSSDAATIIQDDLDLLSRFGTQRPNFGYRTDDHGSTLAAASPLALDDDFDLNGYGIIERMTDADYFSFTTPGGHASIIADAAPFGAMLDLSMSLYDAAGSVLATSATSSLGERILHALGPGTYTLGITGAGNYGDVGQYVISGSAVPEPASAAAVITLLAPALCRRRGR